MKLRKIVDVVVAPKMYLGAIAAAVLTACGTDSPTAPAPDSAVSQPAAASSTPPVAQGPAWELVVTSDDGNKFFVNPKSIRTEDGRFVSIIEGDQKPFGNIQSEDFRVIRDCQTQSWRLDHGDNDLGNIFLVKPGTVGAAKYNFVCARAFGAGGFVRVDE